MLAGEGGAVDVGLESEHLLLVCGGTAEERAAVISKKKKYRPLEVCGLWTFAWWSAAFSGTLKNWMKVFTAFWISHYEGSCEHAHTFDTLPHKHPVNMLPYWSNHLSCVPICDSPGQLWCKACYSIKPSFWPMAASIFELRANQDVIDSTVGQSESARCCPVIIASGFMLSL